MAKKRKRPARPARMYIWSEAEQRRNDAAMKQLADDLATLTALVAELREEVIRRRKPPARPKVAEMPLGDYLTEEAVEVTPSATDDQPPAPAWRGGVKE